MDSAASPGMIPPRTAIEAILLSLDTLKDRAVTDEELGLLGFRLAHEGWNSFTICLQEVARGQVHQDLDVRACKLRLPLSPQQWQQLARAVLTMDQSDEVVDWVHIEQWAEILLTQGKEAMWRHLASVTGEELL